MRIEAVVIPHSQQRYQTTGDWLFGEVWQKKVEGGTSTVKPMLSLRVSAMRDPRYEQAVEIHEIIEALLCYNAGIPEHRVAEFDQLYEGSREANQKMLSQEPLTREECMPVLALIRKFGCNCVPTDTSEPGDDIHAPYYKQHQLATSVERMFIAETGADWNDYEDAKPNDNTTD